MTIGFVLEPTSLDFTSTDGAAIPQALLLNVYETLVRQDESGEFKPLLAKSWTVSGDKLTYDFTLQSGVKFSSGADFTAADAAFSLNRVKTDWKTSVRSTLDVMKNAEAVSPTQLRITLNRPSTSFLFILSTRVGAMFSQTGVDNLAEKPIGTGPYVFTKWVQKDSITLDRNAEYWGSPAAVQTMVLRYFADPTAMNSALLTGGIQVISTVQTPEALSQFDDTSKYQVLEGTSTGEVLLSMNNKAPALADPRVRQAITSALDRKAILETAWSGYGTIIGTHEAPTDPWFFDINPYPYDAQRARDLLAQAGVANLTLSLKLPPVGYAAAAAPLIISQLAAVGITVNDTNVDFPTWLKDVFGDKNYELTIVNHVEPRDAPTMFGNPDYYIGYDNSDVRDLFSQADSELTEEAANQDYREALTQIAEDAPVVWLWSFPNLIVADADVQGIVVNQVGPAFELASLSFG
jgi:peptide/nickel transport system substrate-binding protein